MHTVKDDRTRLGHALDWIGDLALADVRVKHLRELVQSLRTETKMVAEKTVPRFAPRSMLHVYRTLHTMFQTAVSDELLTANPCQLGREELPKKTDRDPTWRATAVFTRGEVEAIVSDDRIPPDCRVLNALLAQTGCRFGEIAALRG